MWHCHLHKNAYSNKNIIYFRKTHSNKKVETIESGYLHMRIKGGRNKKEDILFKKCDIKKWDRMEA